MFERMLPSLTGFSKSTGFDASCYFSAREGCFGEFAKCERSTVDPSPNEMCLKSTPDTEDFSDEQTSSALNAAVTMSHL
jgi:hypothetical protein